MSWIGPVVRNGAKGGMKIAVKYGPQAKIVWDNGGKQVQAAARERVETARSRRTAFAKAATVRDGSVLKQIDDGRPVWVVYSGAEPIAAFPHPSVPIAELVAHADLDARVTVAEHREQQVGSRVRRARGRLPRRRPER